MRAPDMRSQSGMAIVAVMCTMLVLGVLMAAMIMGVGSHMKVARYEVDSEKAFYIAEAGCERAAQYIGNGGSVPGTISGALGDGTYVATIIKGASITDTWHSVGGQININPNNSPNNEFTVTLPDGTTYNRDTLTNGYFHYIGQATYVRVKPKGGAHQNGLTVDGVAYDIDNNKSYEFVSDYMSVSIYNDNVDTNGMAMGQWWISIAAAEADIVVDGAGSGSGAVVGQAMVQFSIISVASVRGRSKVILRETVKQKTWAKYALWMSRNNGIYFKAGEKFYGPVHSNERLTFQGDPEFFDEVTSASTNYSGSTNACIFHKGFQLGASNQTMQSISFSNLQDKATMQLEGQTYFTFSGANLLITNIRNGWSNQPCETATNGLIYVKTSVSGAASTRPADVYVRGTLDGRITLVAERDVLITDHIYYAVDSKTNVASDDALGMIAKRDISVTTNAPNNLNIYAHMIATGLYDTNDVTCGSFGVINYGSGAPRGTLMVHGGIVQNDRGAVGTFNSGTGQLLTGYNKNYTYDTRFQTDPPPDYPALTDQLLFGVWREKWW